MEWLIEILLLSPEGSLQSLQDGIGIRKENVTECILWILQYLQNETTKCYVVDGAPHDGC